uniref:PH domain-containing protein n=1 Tax=Heterorhabditis bacteriophora TaxID=37862 RepID=A0A1I7X3T1_HETBA
MYIFSMREAQYHSAAVPSMATHYTTTPSQLDPALITLTQATHDEERKKKIKEDNKTQKEREKQERKQIKEEKKKHKSRQKEEKKKQKIEKRRKNQMPLKQTCEEQLKQDNSNAFDESKDNDKKREKEDKEEDILRLQISSKNRNEEFGVNSSSKRLEQDVDDSQKSQQLIDTVKKNPAKIEAFISLERQLSNDSQTSSTKSINTVKAQSPKFNHNLSSSNILQHNINSPQSSSTEEERMRRSSDGAKQNTLERRRDSSLSESSRLSFVSHKSVTFSDRIQMHEIERHDILSSSGEDDAAIMSDDELSKSNLERRRRLIRILQSQKNEKNQLINNAEILHMMSPLYSEEEDYKKQENNFFLRQHINQQGTNKSLNLSARFPEYALDSTRNDMDSLSQSSYYPEDQIGPDRFLVEEEDTYISLDQLPLSGREMLRDQNEIAMGSMSKLHFEETRQSSLLPYPSLPRSASGYFEDQYNHQNMRNSYQQAMYSENVFHNSDSFVPTIREDLVYEQQKELQESFYDNVKIKLPSRTNSLTDEHFKFRESNTAKSHTNSISVAEFQESGKNSQDSLEETPVPSPPRKSSSTSIDRTAFFENINDRKREETSSTPTPSPPRVIITQRPAYSQRVLVTSTTTSTAPKRTELMENQESDNNEEVMRRKFVARFGSGRRAPIAEDDPSDPVHSLGSMESVLSTDSRESVISAASIKAEANIRRNFNY